MEIQINTDNHFQSKDQIPLETAQAAHLPKVGTNISLATLENGTSLPDIGNTRGQDAKHLDDNSGLRRNGVQNEKDSLIGRIVPANVFARLYLFFHTEVDCGVLPHILEDLVRRGYYDLDEILAHLTQFQRNCEGSIKAERERTKDMVITSRMFTFLVAKAFDAGLSSYVNDTHLESLARIILRQDDCFEEILSNFCRHHGRCPSSSGEQVTGECSSKQLEVLRICLSLINDGESKAITSIDGRLSCGESSIILAARFRCACALRLLLQNGASVASRWLSFNNIFDVLLFSPHHVHTPESEKEKIKDCLLIALRNSAQVKITSGNLVPRIPEWKQLIPNDQLNSACSLQQLTRLRIRGTLNEGHHLPGGIATLPLPAFLQRYLNLEF